MKQGLKEGTDRFQGGIFRLCQDKQNWRQKVPGISNAKTLLHF